MDPSCCWVPVCPVMAVYQRRRLWRFLSRAWRRWSRFWHSIRYNTHKKVREVACCTLINTVPHTVLSPLFLCHYQKCDVSKHKVLVASVCPQSLPFFAIKFGLDINEASHKLCGFLKSLGELFFLFVYLWRDGEYLCPLYNLFRSFLKLKCVKHSWSTCFNHCPSVSFKLPLNLYFILASTKVVGSDILLSVEIVTHSSLSFMDVQHSPPMVSYSACLHALK